MNFCMCCSFKACNRSTSLFSWKEKKDVRVLHTYLISNQYQKLKGTLCTWLLSILLSTWLLPTLVIIEGLYPTFLVRKACLSVSSTSSLIQRDLIFSLKSAASEIFLFCWLSNFQEKIITILINKINNKILLPSNPWSPFVNGFLTA